MEGDRLCMNDRRADFVLVWWQVLSVGFDIVAIFSDMIIYQENALKLLFHDSLSRCFSRGGELSRHWAAGCDLCFARHGCHDNNTYLITGVEGEGFNEPRLSFGSGTTSNIP